MPGSRWVGPTDEPASSSNRLRRWSEGAVDLGRCALHRAWRSRPRSIASRASRAFPVPAPRSRPGAVRRRPGQRRWRKRGPLGEGGGRCGCLLSDCCARAPPAAPPGNCQAGTEPRPGVPRSAPSPSSSERSCPARRTFRRAASMRSCDWRWPPPEARCARPSRVRRAPPPLKQMLRERPDRLRWRHRRHCSLAPVHGRLVVSCPDAVFSCSISSRVNRMLAAATFSSRWRTVEVPGIGSITCDRFRSQASAI